MKCEYCGYELKETDKFCNECGAKVARTDVNSYQQCSNEISKESVSLIKNESKKTLYKRPVFWIIATEVLLLVIVLIIIISVGNNSTGYIKKPVENYNKVVTTTVVKENQSGADIATESSSTAEPITEEPTTEPPTEKPTEPPVNSYSEGQYKVGTDIPSGQYILYNTSTSKAYYCISSDANGNDIIANNNFKSQNYITVHDGEYLKLVRCEAFSVKDKKEVDTNSGYLTEGHYLVGEDLPAGEYKLTCTDSTKGYYAVCSDDLSDDIIANDNFKGDCYVSVSDGQYLEIVRCKLLLN